MLTKAFTFITATIIGLLLGCDESPGTTEQPVATPPPAVPRQADYLQAAADIIDSYIREHNEVPPTDWGQHLVTQWQEVRDPWGNLLKYTLLAEETFEIRSAGSDGSFDTADDVLDYESEARLAAATRPPERNLDSTAQRMLAIAMAQKFVKDELGSPITAKWPELVEKRKHVLYLGGGRYEVRSWVDAWNSVGASVRTHYTAIVVDKGDVWGLESLTFDE